MRLSKREENSIIIHFSFYTILTFMLIYFLSTSIVSQIKQIEKTKIDVKQVNENIQRVKNQWISYEEFVTMNSWLEWKNDVLTQELLKNMTQDFYIKNLINTSDKTFDEFFKSKQEELNSPENVSLVDDKLNQISQILPSYSTSNINVGTYVLTDYKFVNYVESLLQTFWLTTTSSIWISNIEKVESYIWSEEETDSLDTSIYFIPLTLEITWEKSWIIKLLYYIENVWNIKIINNKIYLNEDNWFLSINWNKITLEWDVPSTDYNILENQIIDIDKISMTDYIDSSYKLRKTQDFIDFLLDNQSNDNFTVSLNLRFYVKWLPFYKVQEHINSILDKYSKTVSLLNEKLKSTEIDDITRRKYSSQLTALNLLNKDISTIRIDMNDKQKLEEVYTNVKNINDIINPILNKLK